MTKPSALQSIRSSAQSVVKAGTSMLSDLLDRIVTGIQTLAAPMAFALGCQAGDASVPPPAPVVREVAPPPVDAGVVETGPRDLGKFNITFYYMIGEDEVVAKPTRKKPPANDNRVADGPVTNPDDATASADPDLAAVATVEQVTLYSGTCEPIAEVSKEFGAQLALQGSGKLKDGRVLNVWGTCSCPRSPCFKVIEQQWGTAGNGRPLQPFRTVAVDPKVIKLGSLLYVPLLEGRMMPGRSPWGGFVHDGCVVADDVGGGIKGQQLDLFVGRKGWFLGISGRGSSHAWARGVPVFDGAKLCERKGRKISRKAGSI
jgi:3D (Asp-Asp-Asp) domain-containing protein